MVPDKHCPTCKERLVKTKGATYICHNGHTWTDLTKPSMGKITLKLPKEPKITVKLPPKARIKGLKIKP